MRSAWAALIALGIALGIFGCPAIAAAQSEEDEGSDDWAEDSDEDEDEEDEDGLQLEWGGKLQSDLRFRVERQAVGAWYDRRELPVGIDRNENIAGLDLKATYGDVEAVIDLDFVIYGFSQDVDRLGDLSRREKVDPFRFEAHQAFIKIKNLIEGLDLSVGQQLVLWGVGDQFNPTNNINPDDLEDVLLFGEQQGTFMVKTDYWVNEDWSISGVVVPIFKPALLPRSGELALASVDRIPVVDGELRRRLGAERAAAELAARHPTIVDRVIPVLPERSIENMQIGYRIAGNIFGQDIAVSYYNGRTDFPIPIRNHTTQDATAQCSELFPETNCVDGLLKTEAQVSYPRMFSYGLNIAGELGIGYRLEAALIVPEKQTIELTNDELALGIATVPAGEYDYDGDLRPGGPRPAVVEDTPFAKWVIGLDYTFSKEVYANVQWVHGLADEYGAGDWISEGDVVRKSEVVGDPDAGMRARDER